MDIYSPIPFFTEENTKDMAIRLKELGDQAASAVMITMGLIVRKMPYDVNKFNDYELKGLSDRAAQERVQGVLDGDFIKATLYRYVLTGTDEIRRRRRLST